MNEQTEFTIQRHIDSPLYGRSVFESVRTEEGGREISNSLLDSILQEKYMDNIIGFYEFENILVEATEEYESYIDILFMATMPKEKNMNCTFYCTMEKLDNIFKNQQKEEFVNHQFDEIRPYLNGYARVSNYWSFGKGKDGTFDPNMSKYN